MDFYKEGWNMDFCNVDSGINVVGDRFVLVMDREQASELADMIISCKPDSDFWVSACSTVVVESLPDNDPLKVLGKILLGSFVRDGKKGEAR